MWVKGLYSVEEPMATWLLTTLSSTNGLFPTGHQGRCADGAGDSYSVV